MAVAPHPRLAELFNRYVQQTCTVAEAKELFAMVEDAVYTEEVNTLLTGLWNTTVTIELDEEQKELIFQTITAGKAKVVPMTRRRWNQGIAVAAIFLLMAVADWLILSDHKKQDQHTIAVTNVKAPASNRATIQLANGKIVYLDSSANGELAMMGDVQLVKLGDGRVTYSGKSTQESYNTLTNPKGSQPIDIGLSDGSHVWLNAGSSITYPVAFVAGKERIVTMTGEAYFEVKHNEKAAFMVKTETQVIEDIGTSFNVNAYPGETGVRTSLVEGSVKIGPATLKPGEQYLNGVITRANLEQALAWKNGFFGFDHADIHTVMREIGRWYDVEVSFEGNVKENAPFQGEIARGLSLAQLLKHLEKYPVHFRMEGSNRVVVSTPGP